MAIGKILKVSVILIIFSWGSLASATDGKVSGKVLRTLTTGDGMWGGCAVQLDVELPGDSGTACTTRWVTFSCVGEYTSKSEGLRMFESAQMALALDKRVEIEVNDEKKHNGICFAKRIDVFVR